jgi:tight adherence protein C
MNDFIVFSSITLAAFAAFAMLESLRNVGKPASRPEDPIDLLDQELLPNWVLFLANAIPQLPVEKRRLKRDLLRTGDYQPHALERYLASRNSRVIAVVIIAAYFCLLLPDQRNLILIGGACASIVFYATPGLLLNRRGDGRVHRIMHALPDALDILSMCLSGGLQVDDSMRHITRFADKSHPDLALEFEIVGRHSAATSSSEAMNRLGARLDVPEIKSLGLLLQQAERLGTSVAQGFDELSLSLRRSFRQKAEARANTLAMQLLFPVVFCLMPPILAILLGPPLIELKEHLQSNLVKSQVDKASKSLRGTAPSP